MPEYRLDELSALSGVSVRNIRAYRERGLLDPPRREGRSAYYSDRHLSQLRTVNELLRKGFTSAHIAEFLDGTRQGRDLADMLGLQQVIFGTPRPADAVDVDPDGDEARRLIGHGLAEIVDGQLTFSDPTVAEIVGRVGDQTTFVQAILGVADRVADRLDELAGVVVETLEECLSADLDLTDDPGARDAVETRRLVNDYGVLGRRVVADRFGAAMKRRLVAVASERADDEAVGRYCEPKGR